MVKTLFRFSRFRPHQQDCSFDAIAGLVEDHFQRFKLFLVWRYASSKKQEEQKMTSTRSSKVIDLKVKGRTKQEEQKTARTRGSKGELTENEGAASRTRRGSKDSDVNGIRKPTAGNSTDMKSGSDLGIASPTGKKASKRKVIPEEDTAEKISAQRRRTAEDETKSLARSVEQGRYALRAKRGAPSFKKVTVGEENYGKVVGKNLKVMSENRTWLNGRIESYDNETNCQRVLYDDGSERQLDMKTVQFEIEVMPGEASALSSREKSNAGKTGRGGDSKLQKFNELKDGGGSATGKLVRGRGEKGWAPILSLGSVVEIRLVVAAGEILAERHA